MTAPSEAALVCVLHDSSALLPDFAAAAVRAIDQGRVRLVMVDSGSRDGSPLVARNVLPESDVIALDGNRGFAAGINAGVAHVRSTGGAEAFVVLNPDMRIGPRTIPVLLDALRRPGVGIALPRLHDEHGDLLHSLRRPPSLRAAWCEALLGGPRAARLRLPTEVVWDSRSYDVDGTPAWGTGGLMAVSDACLRDVGEWDESYFLYEEEVDFCLRAVDAGYRVAYVADGVATRVIGSDAVAPWAQALMRVNRVRLVERRQGRVRAEMMRVALLAGEVLRGAAGRPEARAAAWALRRRATPQDIVGRYRPEAGAVFGPREDASAARLP